ncbi:MAG: hypothetical protein WCH37_03315 [Synechococcaceae cyanobacterium ELA182]
MAKKQAISRRRFLDVAGKLACGGAVVVAVPTFIPASALGRNGRPAPSERVTMACLGLGFGWPMFLRDDVQVLAVCDVRQDRREFGKQQVDQKNGNRDCQTYLDFCEALARDERCDGPKRSVRWFGRIGPMDQLSSVVVPLDP